MAVPEPGRWRVTLDVIGVAGAARQPSENECGEDAVGEVEARGTAQDNERASGCAGSWRMTILKSYRVEKTPAGRRLMQKL